MVKGQGAPCPDRRLLLPITSAQTKCGGDMLFGYSLVRKQQG
jgi:hypothetical protein